MPRLPEGKYNAASSDLVAGIITRHRNAPPALLLGRLSSEGPSWLLLLVAGFLGAGLLLALSSALRTSSCRRLSSRVLLALTALAGADF